MDFLKEYISKETIEQLEETHSKEVLYNFICNKKNIIEVINYLKSININNIEEIILNNISIFTEDIEELRNKLNKYNQKELSEFINRDSNNIELLVLCQIVGENKFPMTK